MSDITDEELAEMHERGQSFATWAAAERHSRAERHVRITVNVGERTRR